MTIVPAKVRELVELFDANIDEYKKPAFNETQLRRQFIDPFFEALGWDVGNAKGYSEQYKEVVHEDSVRDEGRRTAPDYSFRIGKERKFFVEAKRPSVDIAKDKAPAYQLRRYAWNSHLPLSIVSNFAELAVYDTRTKPSRDDSPKTARTLLFAYGEYLTRWDEIAALFSPEAIRRGAFDRYAQSTSRRRGTTTVDRDFLATIESWRETLAKSIFRNNPDVDPDDLSLTVQTLIDRILFLRICEDKGIERLGALAGVKGKDAYDKLIRLFGDAQQKYNAGLFHLNKEGSADKSFDAITAGLSIPDKVVSDLIEEIYYPQSPYEFSVVPPEILGSVYERFLGSVISITGKSLKIELKPELKKAGGVYYTPVNIVRYMVGAALTPVFKTFSAKELPKLRVLDMACGSGSFLIEAYDQLLDWYLHWHIKRGKTSVRYLQKVPNKTGNGFSHHLTLNERRRILLEHIHGVDIDPQAIEVTKLSLFLKLIEDAAVLPAQFELAPFQNRILPDMDKNIRCGNSLVGTDIQASVSLTPEEIGKTRPFDWDSKDGFAAIMAAGKFDLIVGNPPYSYRNATFEKFKPYYAARYASTEGNFDVYKMFLERGVTLLARGGTLCQIVNSSFLIQPQFARLREFLDEHLQIAEIDVMGPDVFEDVTIDTAILRGTLSKRLPAKGGLAVKEPALPSQIGLTEPYAITQARFRKTAGRTFDWRLSDAESAMLDRLAAKFETLDQTCDLSVGINTGMMKAELLAEKRLDNRYHLCVPGNGISRYGPCETIGWILYDPAVIRAAGARGRSLPPERFFSSPKILVVRTRNTSLKRRVVATLDSAQKYNLNRLSNIVAKPGTDIHTVLGIVNSELWNFIFSTRYFNYEIKPVFLKDAPIASRSDRRLAELVEQRLRLESEAAEAKTAASRGIAATQIGGLEARIDARVYELFGLAPDEIAGIKAKLARLPGK